MSISSTAFKIYTILEEKNSFANETLFLNKKPRKLIIHLPHNNV